jgi:uncharacterized membrane protein
MRVPLSLLTTAPAVRQFGLSSAIAATAVNLKGDSGLTAFLGAAAAASSPLFKGVEIAPALTSLSWSVILQSSLVLSVLSICQLQKGRRPLNMTKRLRSLLIAFAMGVVGSVAGAFVGVNVVGVSRDWQIASACLLSSYIGGSVNFFETAGILSTTVEDARLLNLIAGADIFTMIAYFRVLLWTRPMLKGLLQQREEKRDDAADVDENRTEDSSSSSFAKISGDGEKEKQQPQLGRRVNNAVNEMKSVAFSVLLSTMATKCASAFPIPGLSVPISTFGAVTAARSPLFQRLGMVSPGEHTASFMLCLFYAIIGLDCKIMSLRRVGLPVLRLMMTMLATHYATIIGIALLWNTLLRTQGRKSSVNSTSSLMVDADDVIIASNVCIGGASTASSMASGLEPNLVVPASIVGVLGYIVGTPIGLAAARALGG